MQTDLDDDGSPPFIPSVRYQRPSPPLSAHSRDSASSSSKSTRTLGTFQDVSAIELLEFSEGPIFVVDLKDLVYLRAILLTVRLPVIYQNTKMRTSEIPLNAVSKEKEADHLLFRAWVLDNTNQGHNKHHRYEDLSWTACTIASRWKVISGAQGRPELTQDRSASFGSFAISPLTHLDSHETTSETELGRLVEDSDYSENATSDSTVSLIIPQQHVSNAAPLSLSIQSFADSVLRYDWRSTPLGPIDSWPTELRALVNLMLATPSPVVLHWGVDQDLQIGPNLTMLYNEAAAVLYGDKHPYVFAKDPRIAFPSGWAGLAPYVQECLRSRNGRFLDELLVFLDRGSGPREEAYFALAFVPIVGANARVIAWWEPVFEKTQEVLAQRRMSTLLTVSEVTASCSSLKEYWKELLRSFDQNQSDICFGILYSNTDSAEVAEMDSNVSFTSTLTLEGATGISQNHQAVLDRAEIIASQGQAGFIPYLQRAAGLSEPLHLQISDGTLPNNLVAGITSRVYQDPCNGVLVCAIRPSRNPSSDGNVALGYLVLGLNPRRPYDDEYRDFARLLTRQITTSMASLLLVEEEVRRGRTIAEQMVADQRKVEEQMRTRTREWEKSEFLYKRLVDAVPVGLFVMDYPPGDPNGSYVYRNEKWFEMTLDDRSNLASWKSPIWSRIHPDDITGTHERWLAFLSYPGSGTRIEYRIKVRNLEGEDNLSNENYIWVLLNAVSYRHDDGSLKAVVASVADISSNKEAEDLQKKGTEDAVESKRVMERFIDVTSHEMRNPLGAILISAEDVINACSTFKANMRDQTQESTLNFIEDIEEGARTILHCAEHQKRIVNDVLTMSKIESGLFDISPVEVKVEEVVKDMLKMFEAEFKAKDINPQLIIGDSFTDLGIVNVLLDPSRLLQILINLVTNAIKFTAQRPTRVITLHLAASLEQPHDTEGFAYLPFKKPIGDLTLKAESGEGKAVYLLFSVEDTGCGLSEEDMKLLFNRFSQAPRSHIKYGGSGLGLFISRELTEMQGGRIGVSSVHGSGTTFKLYIKSRMAVCPSRSTIPTFKIFEATPKPTRPPAPKRHTSLTQSPPTTPIIQETIRIPLQSPPLSFNILLVEDNLINQKVLSKQLRKAGHHVTIANHGVEALDFIDESVYRRGHEMDGKGLHIVLLDIEMPVMDGVTCIKRIRELQAESVLTKHLPVIALTANARVEQIKEYREAGMDEVISKPFSVSNVLATVGRLVSTR